MELCREAYVSAEQSAAKQGARVSQADGNEAGSRRIEAPPDEGPQAAHRSRAYEVALSAGALAFPKSARLLQRAQFLQVKEQGKGFVDGPLAASYIVRPALPTRASPGNLAVARVGLVVSSKVGESVVRNQVKRRLKEAVRHELSSLPAVDLVLVARASSTRATVLDFRHWLKRASKRIAASIEPAP